MVADRVSYGRRSVSAGEQVPAALQTPLAVAQHLLEAPVKAAEDPARGAEEELEKEGGSAAGEGKEEAGEKVSVIQRFGVRAGHALCLAFCARVDDRGETATN